jgi:drug/metabolite transporter (DMT)-like permease
MVLIWGTNYSVVKAALREIPPAPFNALRVAIASLLFLAAIAARRVRSGAAAPFSPRDRVSVLVLGIVCHFIYQVFFISGLGRTSAANTALIIGCTPVLIALMTAALGHEHIGRTRWFGTLLSVLGIYFVVGHGGGAGDSLAGDAMMLGAVICWSAASVGSRGLLARHSPVAVTGWSMTVGAVCYVAATAPQLARLDYAAVGAAAWLALAASAALALFSAYLIWFTGVQRLGPARTSAYSNMVPLVGMLVAWAALGEPLGVPKLAGAAAILIGIGLARR